MRLQRAGLGVAEDALLGQIDLDAEQPALPRAFKTHSWRDHCPAGGRYIVCVRDPRDAATPQIWF